MESSDFGLAKGRNSRICAIRSHEPVVRYVPETYLNAAGFSYVDVVDVERTTYERQLSEILSKKYDLIINLCDACMMNDNAGLEVCSYLNAKCNVPFVGPTVKEYDMTREKMKMACDLIGIRTPKFVFIYDLKSHSAKLNELQFPLIVKHFNSGGSFDLLKESRVANREELDIQLNRMVDRNHGALVEEFIQGREFTCLLTENADDPNNPIVYEPLEYLFLNEGDTFCYQSLKYGQMKDTRVSDPSLSLRIKQTCSNYFKALSFTSYARCDIRMNSAGQLFMLEINPIPAVFKPSDKWGATDNILKQSPGGHNAFLQNIIKMAVRRHTLRWPGWQVEHDQASGYCCKAVRQFQVGDVVEDFESKQARLTPADRLEKVAEGSGQVKNHPRFYLPVSERYVITSDNEIDHYKFLRPSEDPNCWLEGLRIAARRDIAAGEELTFDYSTLYGDSWRNLVGVEQSETDWAAIAEKYSGHVSSFVKGKAQEMK